MEFSIQVEEYKMSMGTLYETVVPCPAILYVDFVGLVAQSLFLHDLGISWPRISGCGFCIVRVFAIVTLLPTPKCFIKKLLPLRGDLSQVKFMGGIIAPLLTPCFEPKACGAD
ncbi:hypothetical protein NC653_028317 [Populus alba x Populus x berolinensis]|uniref:Uncharacterized protein n=1 Tax=Populus alba x Populus x berolinensis TaxID=444605 RepID=A0AAD6M7P1_9ROSI|nr:hypothetical protein NC653_028317 [Populus alba x Populus x berolinensis]